MAGSVTHTVLLPVVAYVWYIRTEGERHMRRTSLSLSLSLSLREVEIEIARYACGLKKGGKLKVEQEKIVVDGGRACGTST